MPLRKQQGQVLIFSLIFMLVILVVVGILLGFVQQNTMATRRALAKEQALELAEGGIDKAVWQLNQTAGTYSGETGTVLGTTGAFDVSVASLSGTLKEITAIGYAPSKTAPLATRTIKVQVSIDTTVVNFRYGVLVGEGGMEMQSSARVVGNVYSNGQINGRSGTATITGDAYSAGPGGKIYSRLRIDGNAYAHQFDDVTVGGSAYGQTMNRVTVGGNVYSYAISNCTIGGNASYTTKTSCTIGGTQTTPYPGESDPPPETFPPIPNSQLDDWKSQAAAGGTITGNYSLSGTAQASLGPKKITGNLTLSNSARLTLTGPIWVVGQIRISNSSVVALDSSYGNNSEVMIADGTVEIQNNPVFQRAGPASYIMVVTTAPGIDDQMEIENSADALIAYAPNGEVELNNSVRLREVVGYRVELKNSAQVTYESGLANVNFSSGPGGSWQVVRGTWREIK